MRIKFTLYICIGSCIRIIIGIVSVISRFYRCSNSTDASGIQGNFFLYARRISRCSFIRRIGEKIASVFPGVLCFSCILSFASLFATGSFAVRFLCCNRFCLPCICALYSRIRRRRKYFISPVREIPEFSKISGKIRGSQFCGQRYTFDAQFQTVPVFDKLEWFYQRRISHRNLVCRCMLERSIQLINTVINCICISLLIKCIS